MHPRKYQELRNCVDSVTRRIGAIRTEYRRLRAFLHKIRRHLRGDFDEDEARVPVYFIEDEQHVKQYMASLRDEATALQLALRDTVHHVSADLQVLEYIHKARCEDVSALEDSLGRGYLAKTPRFTTYFKEAGMDLEKRMEGVRSAVANNMRAMRKDLTHVRGRSSS